MNCFVCSLPFSDTEARYVKGKPVCLQCQNIVEKTEAAAQPAEPASAAAPTPAPAGKPQAAPRISMPAGGGSLYFEHSGAGTVNGLLLMPVAGIAAAMLLGYPYAWFSCWNPFIYFTALATIGYGLAIGAAIGLAAKATDSRNLGITAGLGFLSGLVALWWGWAVWLQAAGYAGSLSLSPGAILAGVSKAAAAESWVIRGITFSGTAIKLCWGLEALILLGLPCLTALGTVGSAPFCERCRKWLPDPFIYEKLAPISDPDSFRGRLEKGDFSAMSSLFTLKSAPSSYTRLEVSSCPQCERLHTFSAVLCTVVPAEDEKDEDGLDEELVVDQLLVTKELADWVRQLPPAKY